VAVSVLVRRRWKSNMVIPGNPAHERFPQIKIRHLVGNPADVAANQLWGDDSGVVR
jgi:hypothetical protein